jgi:DNA-binding response OmpR family regulator
LSRSRLSGVSTPSDRARVLIVDDEERVADTYRLRLQSTYDVDVALGGRDALELVSDDHDVVLLDRRMPDISGDEVLDEIRSRDLDCKVVMVTAVDPDFDIVEMQCDDYIVKPVDDGQLQEVVDRVLRIAEYSERRQKLGAKKLKRNVLELEMRDDELGDSEEYQRLEDEIADLETEVDELEDELGLENVDRFL